MCYPLTGAWDRERAAEGPRRLKLSPSAGGGSSPLTEHLFGYAPYVHLCAITTIRSSCKQQSSAESVEEWRRTGADGAGIVVPPVAGRVVLGGCVRPPGPGGGGLRQVGRARDPGFPRARESGPGGQCPGRTVERRPRVVSAARAAGSAVTVLRLPWSCSRTVSPGRAAATTATMSAGSAPSQS